MSFNGFYQRLGKIIRQHRERKNYTQEYVADASRVDRTYIARIESGKANPTIKVLYKISKIFQIPLGEFLKEL
jgi:transcriptional regulator with XRE-family HTH domain